MYILYAYTYIYIYIHTYIYPKKYQLIYTAKYQTRIFLCSHQTQRGHSSCMEKNLCCVVFVLIIQPILVIF